jgi:hypothetical protein
MLSNVLQTVGQLYICFIIIIYYVNYYLFEYYVVIHSNADQYKFTMCIEWEMQVCILGNSISKCDHADVERYSECISSPTLNIPYLTKRKFDNLSENYMVAALP